MLRDYLAQLSQPLQEESPPQVSSQHPEHFAAWLFATQACGHTELDMDRLCAVLAPLLGPGDKLGCAARVLSWFERIRVKLPPGLGNGTEVLVWLHKDDLLRDKDSWNHHSLTAYCQRRAVVARLAVKAGEVCAGRMVALATADGRQRLLKKVEGFEKLQARVTEPPSAKPRNSKPVKDQAPSPPSPLPPSEDKGLSLFFDRKEQKSPEVQEFISQKHKHAWNVLGSFPAHARRCSDDLLRLVEAAVPQRSGVHSSPPPEPTPRKSLKSSGAPLELFFRKKRVNPIYTREALLQAYSEQPLRGVPQPTLGSRYKFIRFEDGEEPREWKGTWSQEPCAIRGRTPLVEAVDVVNYEIGSGDELQLLDAESCSRVSDESEGSASAELSGFLVPDDPETAETGRLHNPKEAELFPVLIDGAVTPQLLERYKAFCLVDQPAPFCVTRNDQSHKTETNPLLLRRFLLLLIGLPSRKEAMRLAETMQPGLTRRTASALIARARRVFVVNPARFASHPNPALYVSTFLQNYDLSAGVRIPSPQADWPAALAELLHGTSTSSVIKEERVTVPLMNAFPSVNRAALEKKIREVARPGLMVDVELLSNSVEL